MAMADTFQVQVEFEGQTHTFPCQSDQTVLAAAEAANVDLAELLLCGRVHHLRRQHSLR